jgi:hypothetical protein
MLKDRLSNFLSNFLSNHLGSAWNYLVTTTGIVRLKAAHVGRALETATRTDRLRHFSTKGEGSCPLHAKALAGGCATHLGHHKGTRAAREREFADLPLFLNHADRLHGICCVRHAAARLSLDAALCTRTSTTDKDVLNLTRVVAADGAGPYEILEVGSGHLVVVGVDYGPHGARWIK